MEKNENNSLDFKKNGNFNPNLFKVILDYIPTQKKIPFHKIKQKKIFFFNHFLLNFSNFLR